MVTPENKWVYPRRIRPAFVPEGRQRICAWFTQEFSFLAMDTELRGGALNPSRSFHPIHHYRAGHITVRPRQYPSVFYPYRSSYCCFALLRPIQPWCGTSCESSTARTGRPTSAGRVRCEVCKICTEHSSTRQLLIYLMCCDEKDMVLAEQDTTVVRCALKGPSTKGWGIGI